MAEWEDRTAKMRLGGKKYPRLLLMRASGVDAIMCLLGWQNSKHLLGSGFLSTFWLPTLTQPLDTMLHNGLDPHPNEHVAVYEPPSAASDHLRPKAGNV